MDDNNHTSGSAQQSPDVLAPTKGEQAIKVPEPPAKGKPRSGSGLARPDRRVDVTLRSITEQRWGDSYNEAAGQATTNVQVILRQTVPMFNDRRDARHALGRLLFNVDPYTGVAGHVEVGSAEPRLAFELDETDRPGRAYEAAAVFQVLTRPADEVVAKVKEYADELRAGRHDPPTITVEQSRLFSELGIALRTDGIFGYKRKCARDGCDKPGGSDDCFGSLEPADAIAGARKRDAYTCSTSCWIEIGWAKDWGLDDKVLEYVDTVDGAREDLEAAGCLAPKGDCTTLVADWWSKAKAHDDARGRVLEIASELAENTDDGNEDAIECEVAA